MTTSETLIKILKVDLTLCVLQYQQQQWGPRMSSGRECTAQMQGEKGTQTCAGVLWKFTVQNMGELSTLSVSLARIFHCSRFPNVSKCFSRGDKEIDLIIAVLILNMNRKVIVEFLDFLQGSRITIHIYNSIDGFNFWGPQESSFLLATK